MHIYLRPTLVADRVMSMWAVRVYVSFVSVTSPLGRSCSARGTASEMRPNTGSAARLGNVPLSRSSTRLAFDEWDPVPDQSLLCRIRRDCLFGLDKRAYPAVGALDIREISKIEEEKVLSR